MLAKFLYLDYTDKDNKTPKIIQNGGKNELFSSKGKKRRGKTI